MKNYICVNGSKTELTNEQLEKLGLSPEGRTVGDIVEIIRAATARDAFKIHDTFSFGGHELEIIGIDHDKVHEAPSQPTITFMLKTLLPDRRMHNGKCEKGWIDTELRAWLNNEFINQLPEELTKHIPAVDKLTHGENGGGSYNSASSALSVPLCFCLS